MLDLYLAGWTRGRLNGGSNYSKRILLALAGRHLKHLGQATGIILLGRRGSINSGLNRHAGGNLTSKSERGTPT